MRGNRIERVATHALIIAHPARALLRLIAALKRMFVFTNDSIKIPVIAGGIIELHLLD
jgi:hypothetical protein